MNIHYRTLAGICLLLCAAGCEGSVTENNQDTTTVAATTNSKTSPIDGAWAVVWEDVGGNISSTGKPTQLKLFTDGYFSYIMRDSAGNWSNAGGGTFELSDDGKTYKEAMLYNTNPDYVGATDWQEYEMKGDTLIFKPFTKVVMRDGRDVTSLFPKSTEKRVRAGTAK